MPLTQSQVDFYLNQARSSGVPESFIQDFISRNPGDYHRILAAYTSGQTGSGEIAQAVESGILPVGTTIPTPPGYNPLPNRPAQSLYAPYQGTIDIQPSNATSGPPGALGYANSSDLTGYRAPRSSEVVSFGGGGLFSNPLLLIGLAVAAYFVWKEA